MPFPVVPPSSSGTPAPATVLGIPDYTPDLEVRATWRPEQFDRATNGDFEAGDTTGWSVSAGINGAGTSITITSTDSYRAGYCGRLQAAAGSETGGHYDLGADRYFRDDHHSTRYVARVALKRNSGTRQVKLILGSLGTSTDRAELEIDELEDVWREYLVAWRPSGDRTDAEVAIVTNDGQALDVLVDELTVWSPLASQVENGSFLTDTTGWLVDGSLIAGAATSIARAPSDGIAYGGSCGVVTMPATTNTGADYDLGTRSFLAGRTYRLRLGMRLSQTGGSSVRLRFGSLSASADRADDTVTVDSWAWHTLDWTPTADRTDAVVSVANGSASATYVRIAEVEVYEALDELTMRDLQVTIGATSGSSSATPVGTLSGTLPDLDGTYDPHNSASELAGIVDTGVPLWVRGTYDGQAHGVGWGRIDAIMGDPYLKEVSLTAADGLGDLEGSDIEVPFDFRHSYADARDAALTLAGVGAFQRDLTEAGVESSTFFDGTDTASSALAYLAALNTATETIHVAEPSAHANVGWVYATIDRATLTSDRVDFNVTEDSRGKLPGMERRADTRITASKSGYSSYDLMLAPGRNGYIDYPWGAVADINGKRILAIGADPVSYPTQVPFMRFTDEAIGSSEVPEPTVVWELRRDTTPRVFTIAGRRKIVDRRPRLIKERRIAYEGAIFPMSIPTGESRTLTVEFNVPVADLEVSADSTDTTISWDAEPSRVTITLRAEDTTGVVTGLAVAGFPLLPRAEGEVSYRGVSASGNREHVVGDYTYVPGPAAARGVGQYLVWRYEDSRLAPTVTDGKKPVRQLTARVGQHAALTVSRYRIDGMNTLVRGVTHRISQPWPWYTDYVLEELRDGGGDFVTIDGTADDGIAGGVGGAFYDGAFSPAFYDGDTSVTAVIAP